MKTKGQVARVDRLRISRRGAEAPIPPEGRAPRVPRILRVRRTSKIEGQIWDSRSSSLRGLSILGLSLRIESSTFMPRQHVYFSLIRPVFRTTHQASADRILPNVMPLFGVAFPAPELTVEEVLLPYRLRARVRPMARRLCSPEAHPVLERSSWKHRRRAEQMKMIRHDHVPSHEPVARPFPLLEQHRVNLWKVQQQSSPSYANGHELDDRLIGEFARRQVRQRISARVSLKPWHAAEANGSFVLAQAERNIRHPRTTRRDELRESHESFEPQACRASLGKLGTRGARPSGPLQLTP